MNKYKNLIFVMVVALILGACAKPETPTAVQIAEGVWVVESVIANGEVNPQYSYSEGSVLHLDRNETFLFVHINGTATAGTWTATDTQLTLTVTSPEAGTQNYTIVNLEWEKMHIFRTIQVGTTTVELRYLLARVE
jgi:hypothetical protein